MKQIYFTNNPFQSKKLGEKLAREILRVPPEKRAMVIGLEGGLGGGKTTFLQGFAKGLGIKQKILSPTFVILKKFKVQSSKFKVFYHIDCYRIKKPKEILDLGLKKIVSEPRNIVAVEWADRIKRTLPGDSLILKFDFIDEKTRKIAIKKPNSYLIVK